MKNCLIAIIALWLSTPAHGQETDRSIPHRDEPPFYFDALVFASREIEKPRLDVYVQVPYEVLRFVHKDGQYAASYEKTVTVFDGRNNLVGERLSVEHVRLASFDETRDPARYDLTQRFFALSPGTYRVDVQIRDLEIRRTWRQERMIEVRDLHAGEVLLSDLMLVSQVRTEGDRRMIVPNVSGNIAHLPEGFYIFCELYNQSECDTLNVIYKIFTARNEEILTHAMQQPVIRGTNQLFIKIDSREFVMGRYSIKVTVDGCVPHRDNISVFTSIQRPFSIQWRGIPLAIGDIDTAIEQLSYIAEPGEMDSLRKAQTIEEKRARFKAFWDKRDPTPGTEYNERMVEHYRRVAYANQQFTHYIDGWKTDRGMVYILLGPPNTVDRHPFSIDAKPYEIWYYDDINQRFLFVDWTGFGDYRLDPSTPIWDALRRRR